MKTLKYSMINNEPVSITDLYNSKSDEACIMLYITGSAVRGAVMNRLAGAGKLEGDVKKAFFDGRISFGNAYPVLADHNGKEHETVPSPKGFYEDRDGSGKIEHSFIMTEHGQMKRAKVGSFAVLDSDGSEVLFYSIPAEGENFKTRLARNSTDKGRDKNQALFRGSYLEKNQKFSGEVFFSESCEDTLAELVKEQLEIPGLQIGSLRGSGHGSVSINSEWNTQHDEKLIDSILKSDMNQDGFYQFDLLCLSGLCMTNEFGEPCGLNTDELCEKLGLTEAAELSCTDSATSVTHYCSFNRNAGGRSAEIPVFEGGSIFRIQTKELPGRDAMLQLEKSGIGLLRNEGFGRIRFFDHMERFTKKEKLDPYFVNPAADGFKNSPVYQADVDAMTITCAKSILRMKMNDAITDYILKNPLKATNETNSQRGMISMLCKNFRYEPEKALEQFDEYIGHANYKDAHTRVYRAKTNSRSELLNEVTNILTTPLLSIISPDCDTVCGLKVKDLISKSEEMSFKIDLIEALMSYINRAGKEKANG